MFEMPKATIINTTDGAETGGETISHHNMNQTTISAHGQSQRLVNKGEYSLA